MITSFLRLFLKNNEQDPVKLMKFWVYLVVGKRWRNYLQFEEI